MKKTIFSLIFFVASLSLSSFGQIPQIPSVNHNVHKINSQVLGEERTVLVRVPPAYQLSDQKYPVVYMLDAHSPQNAMMAGIVDQQAWGGKTPEMIIVGIQNTNRTRDLTPTKTQREGSGGGEKFLRFIETEVIPLVEKNYRTQPFRVFAGHSLGGMFAVYSFVKRPDLFNAYIAASPVLHWDNNYVIKRAEEIFKQKRDWNKTMFIGVGNEPEYFDGFKAFQDLLRKSKPKDFEYEFREFKEDNHGSVVLPAYYEGFRKIFAGWESLQNGTIADLEDHYNKLSKRFGYQILIPENTLNDIGYQLLNANRNQEAIDIFKKNAELYPKSVNVYDSLGEAFEKNGQLKLALENYEKAYKLAEASGHPDLIRYTKANFERISAKLK